MIKYTKKEKAEKLKKWRTQTKLNAKQFARLNKIPYSTYIKWEEGVTEIPYYMLELLVVSMIHYELL